MGHFQELPGNYSGAKYSKDSYAAEYRASSETLILHAQTAKERLLLVPSSSERSLEADCYAHVPACSLK